MIRSVETEVVKEFEPELGGERVAWIHKIHRSDDDRSFSKLYIATAHVAEAGGTISVKHFLEDGEVDGSHITTQGILGATAVEYAFTKEEQRHPGNPFTRVICQREPDAEGFAIQDVQEQMTMPWEGGGEWHVGDKAIIGAIKEHTTDDYSPEFLYPWLYYSLNRILIDRMEDLTTYRHRIATDEALPDPTMHEQTKVELDAMVGYLAATQVVVAMDRRVLGILEAGDDVASHFEQSRRQLHDHNLRIQEALDTTLFDGYIRTNRDWPYMDYSVANDWLAYGLELRDLQRGDAGRAIYELKREIREEELLRLPTIQNWRTMLSAMYDAEARVIDKQANNL